MAKKSFFFPVTHHFEATEKKKFIRIKITKKNENEKKVFKSIFKLTKLEHHWYFFNSAYI